MQQRPKMSHEEAPHEVIAGVDFNHDRVRVLLGDGSGSVLGENFADIDVDRSAAYAIDVAVDIIKSLRASTRTESHELAAVGVGLPGPIDTRTGALASAEILPGWAGLPVREVLSRRLGVDVVVDNDANLGALGEISFGAGRGLAHVIYVRVESGIGAALVINGQLFHGAVGLAGEIGHIEVRSDGALCRCGNRGCLETLASEGVIASLIRDVHGEEVTRRRILDLVASGDPGAKRVVSDAGWAVGRVLAGICNVFNPEAVIVGGELAVAGDVLIDAIRAAIDRHALTRTAEAVAVLPGELGERAEALGALALVGAEMAARRSSRPAPTS